MTKADKNQQWRDRQADVLRENLKKRKVLQKARAQEASSISEKKEQDT